jgi:hypothetical protein
MSERPTSEEGSSVDQILDLLLEALAERQSAREEHGKPSPERFVPDKPPEPEPLTPSAPAPQPVAERSAPEPATEMGVEITPPGDQVWNQHPPLPSIHLGRTLGRLLLVLAVLVVLVNVPVNRYGTSLARIMPDSASLVIRDGLVLKGSGSDIYVLEDNRLRWISSLEAFEYFGYQWEQVRIVEDGFLAQFEQGRPIHILLKCDGSPHIYALENGRKRWIKDIPTFEAEGYVWEDVKHVTCHELVSLPDGPPIPEDAGSPPESWIGSTDGPAGAEW